MVADMMTVTVEIPDEALDALGTSLDGAGDALRFVAAAKLYEIGRLSSGAAARLAGIPRVVFLSRLAELGIAALDTSLDDLREDVRRA